MFSCYIYNAIHKLNIHIDVACTFSQNENIKLVVGIFKYWFELNKTGLKLYKVFLTILNI